jgi:lysophospholipase L1-like esterase
MDHSRRDFIRYAGVGAGALTSLSLLAKSCKTGEPSTGIPDYFNEEDVILFQGDSITDAERNKELGLPNDASSFGNGYAHLAASFLLEALAGKNLTLYNRGISGNKVFQLADRWDKDCLDLKPDVLSILIGVNDYWHMRDGHYDGTPEIYERDYRALLQRTKDCLPELKLIICQPFILTETRAVDETWVEPFRAYQEIAESMAEEFGATWVPFQAAFNRGTSIAHQTYWTADGVHPSMAGAQLMAKTWLEALA